MSDAENSFKEWYRIIFLIAISVTVIFLAVFAMLGLRVNADLTCGKDTIGPNANAQLDNHTHQLDGAADYILQEFELNSTQYLKHEFCFTVYCVGANGAKIEVINDDLSVLSNEFAIQGPARYCSNIKNVTDHQYLGLRCPTCINAPAECFVQEVIAGDTVIHVENQAASISVTENPIMSYTLYSYKDCRGLIKFFLWCYIWLMVALFFVVLILLGFRRFEKFIFEEMNI